LHKSFRHNDDFVSEGYLIDKIFNNLMENGYNYNIKQNKYIFQLVNKFQLFRLKSPNVYFEIHIRDLDSETIQLLEVYTRDCSTRHHKYLKLNWVFTEVITRIAKQAEPQIISIEMNENTIVWWKSSLNEIREITSLKWMVVSN
jgi:hypothetical protein